MFFGYPESGVGFGFSGFCSSHFKRWILLLDPRVYMLE